jgi:antitoxin PrlF
LTGKEKSLLSGSDRRDQGYKEMAMAHALLLEEVSTVTAKGQTTVPKSVRQVLGISAGDQIAFRVEGEAVTIHRVDEQHDDPALGAFLDFLAKDIQDNPSRMEIIAPETIARLSALVEGVDVDLDAPIEGETAI